MKPILSRSVLMLGVMCSVGSTALANAAAPPVSLELPMLDGTRFVRLVDFTGQPVLLNFWGSECPPCIHEMPLLMSLASHYPGVQFLGIAVDDRASAGRFLARLAASYPQLVAPTQPAALMRRFGNKQGALPYTVVLNARHQLCATQVGAVSAGWIANAVETCVAGLAVSAKPVAGTPFPFPEFTP